MLPLSVAVALAEPLEVEVANTSLEELESDVVRGAKDEESAADAEDEEAVVINESDVAASELLDNEEPMSEAEADDIMVGAKLLDDVLDCCGETILRTIGTALELRWPS